MLNSFYAIRQEQHIIQTTNYLLSQHRKKGLCNVFVTRALHYTLQLYRVTFFFCKYGIFCMTKRINIAHNTIGFITISTRV